MMEPHREDIFIELKCHIIMYINGNRENGPLYTARFFLQNEKEHPLGIYTDNVYTCSSHVNENTLNDNSPK